MNRKLTDEQIVSTFEALRAAGTPVSGRALRAALRRQFGAAGKTDRVFAVCRTPRPAAMNEPAVIAELRGQVLEAERGKAEAQHARDHALQRAERSETREVAHQDLWANEIYTLRQTVQQLNSESTRCKALDEQVVRLHRELQALRRRLACYEKSASNTSGAGERSTSG